MHLLLSFHDLCLFLNLDTRNYNNSGRTTPKVTTLRGVLITLSTFSISFYSIRDIKCYFLHLEHHLSSSKPHSLFSTETHVSGLSTVVVMLFLPTFSILSVHPLLTVPLIYAMLYALVPLIDAMLYALVTSGHCI